ncbi:MAG: NADPH-dependent 7-cyano-7-deazaguanine reductase QueF [Rubrivivax sp.]|nr:MAG: NADPH-dependent 7-cyano-7-deazaguanine reductase QueF [Rubrivivax sp.]
MAKKASVSSSAPAPSKQAAKPAARRKAAASVSVGERAKPAKPPSAPSKTLDVFPNPAPQRDYVIQFQIPEFTCFCPLTGQPDFAHFTIDCIADKQCIELKSLKMYMWAYRNEGAFHEKVTNDILGDMVQAINPRFLRITAKWYVRGGIYTNVVVEHRKAGWKPQPRVDLPQHTAETGLMG